MENLKILIVEDEILIAEDLKDLLLSFGIKSIELSHDKENAFQKINTFKPDIILLDIRLEGNNDGLDIANYLQQSNQIPHIFITSHSDVEMIKEIVKTNPAGYITKPFKKSDLFASINLTALKIQESVKTIQIKDGYDTHIINHVDINFIKSEGNYIDIFVDTKKITCRKSLESILIDLNNPQFFKISKSCIVNIDKISLYNTKEVVINNVSISVSRNLIEEFEAVMKKRKV